VIAVNKKADTVGHLEARLAALYDIPADNLLLLLRHEHLFNQTVRSEVYNMDWRRDKTIEDASRLDHGTVLYLEEGNPKGKLEEHRWHQEFTKDQDRLSLSLNDPHTDPDGHVFSVKLDVRKDNTLLELKQRVGELFGLNTSEFVLKRYLNHRELKNMSAKLAELGITNQSVIKVERGRPHQDGVYEVNVW